MDKGLYRHYKGGEYLVIAEAVHTETEERLVVYVDEEGNTWVRPEEMFKDTVIVEGQEVPRFIQVRT